MPADPRTVFIILPCFNEGMGVVRLADDLQEVIQKLDFDFHIVIVDDCSDDNTAGLLGNIQTRTARIKYSVLHLKFNMGHQAAIYQGLLFARSLNAANVIVMDCDGEDDPRAIPLLLQKMHYDIVEVRRGRRSNSIPFLFGLFFYKLLFRLITGKVIDFGNYCMINNKILERIAITSFIHFPAYLLKQKASFTRVTFDRGKRIQDKSKMGYKGLMMHAFRSMVEFGEDLLFVFLKLFVVIVFLILFLLGNILYQKFISHTAILGWFSTILVSLVILAVLCLGLFVLGILVLNISNYQAAKRYGNIYHVLHPEPRAENEVMA